MPSWGDSLDESAWCAGEEEDFLEAGDDDLIEWPRGDASGPRELAIGGNGAAGGGSDGDRLGLVVNEIACV
jgi:hypothetical protein